MCFVLHEATTGFRPTQTVVAKLIIYSINRGIVLTVMQILQTALIPSTNRELDQIFYFPMSTGENTAFYYSYRLISSSVLVYVNAVLAVYVCFRLHR
ncbi:uncharacterized protein LAESUDRAFT_724300 [Laetiporus sulphureus 93-53]|uniref:Uncharacterized protein n=1 Tax=Laetiporus sulphureus 93-53 TaxID=1314785 RepID=A0A165F363_9APHY|nr:uncharacterized protein LAESUDRAFT_724300 [Laetiporus sulphureus 93-53]KZT08280.1 hypothetical protein LAESUDRAFT_724300 [Laetiporus sulphureus 93-53]